MKFRALAAILFVTTIVAAVYLGTTGPRVNVIAVIILGSLFALAEHECVRLPDGSSMSAGFMLAMAAVVVFEDGANLLGPLLVGTFGCLHWPHLRSRSWSKIAANAGIFGLSSLGAASIALVIPAQLTHSITGQMAAALPVGLTFSLINYLLLVPVIATLNRVKASAVANDLWLGDLQIYPFALLGVMLGRMYMSFGPWLVPLFVAPIFIARQAFASYLELRAAQEATLNTLIRALEAKDRYTAGHAERVARFAEYMGRELGFRPARLQRLRYAALMHDIGKLVVPNQILNKPGRLTPEEFARIRYHEVVSVELLRRIDFLAPVVPDLEAERGKDLADESVAIEARIIAVADAFDAMTSTRAYRRALSQDVAFAELRDKSGSQFDPGCVEALIEAIQRRGERYGAGYEDDVVLFASPPPVAGIGSAGLGDLLEETEGVRA